MSGSHTHEATYSHGILCAPPVSKAGNGIGRHLAGHTVFAGLPGPWPPAGVHRPLTILQHWGGKDLALNLQKKTKNFIIARLWGLRL